MNRYEELQALIRTFEKDFTKFYDKGNKEAGIRLRKQMQTLRAFAKTVRDEVQEKNNPSTSIDAGK
ncbi:MAG: histone H1 [Ignavibacteria bacterium]|nr:histone H1 [Ignavibacteria bacterium]